MSKDQIEAQKQIIAKEKRKITPKPSERVKFRKRILRESYDPAHLMT